MDDFVAFSDASDSLESSLLWSTEVGRPAAEDYLEFIPEHERRLAGDYTSVKLSVPPRVENADY